MGYVIRMPQMGMSMDQGTVVEWLVDEGDPVEVDDPVVVVESEKASNEVEAREAGVLRRIYVGADGAVGPGTPIGVIAGEDEDLEGYESGLDLPTGGAEADEPAGAAAAPTAAPEATASDSTASRSADVKATPGARQLAEEAGVDLGSVEGTGPQGVITDADVEAHVEAGAPSSAEAAGATRTVSESRPLTGMQATISDRLSRSYREAVHVTLNRSFGTATLRGVVDRAKRAGVDGGMTDLLVKAVGETLGEHPGFNATFEDGEHRLIEEANVGIAVDIDEGLVAPVVPAVSTKTAEEVNAVRGELTDRVRSGEFSMDDLAGGTFTVTNLGVLGIDDFDPIINPPQVAILGVGRIRDDGSMTLSLSFDHRVVNGADAARFLDTLVGKLTDAGTLAGYYGADIGEVGGSLGAREIVVENAAGYDGRYRTRHGDVRFDEPESLGGSGSAPAPVDHLLGALGSCLSLAVRAVSTRDGIDVGAITTTVNASPDEGALDAVRVRLEIEADADDDALSKAVTKGERACYVSRTLADDLPVDVEWERAA